MRVIAGAAKGRRLQVPRGRTVRPSGAKWRESAFGIVEHRMPIADAAVLDLYAGSGALGIEALSRGARSVVAVEQDRETARVLARNASACGLEERLEVLVEPVLAALGRPPDGCSTSSSSILLRVRRHRRGAREAGFEGLVAPSAWWSSSTVVGTSSHAVLLSVELERRYGDSLLTLLRQRPGPRGSRPCRELTRATSRRRSRRARILRPDHERPRRHHPPRASRLPAGHRRGGLQPEQGFRDVLRRSARDDRGVHRRRTCRSGCFLRAAGHYADRIGARVLIRGLRAVQTSSTSSR